MSDLAYTAMLIGSFVVLVLILRGIEQRQKAAARDDVRPPPHQGQPPR
ncbi:MAG: hypothetical protein JWQ81_4813 [Amycolatopsis sp.]|jgi:hypothetical protein|nr:hypothetical protein [Amycolatopsis sp.]MCU1684074.1 hypothetical protein [Amycolatopsis sp.]